MIRGNKTTIRYWGLSWAIFIFCLWLIFWVILMGFFPKVQIAGIPVITWSQIFLAIFAICVSIFGIFKLERLD
jgi:hypothetical protein